MTVCSRREVSLPFTLFLSTDLRNSCGRTSSKRPRKHLSGRTGHDHMLLPMPAVMGSMPVRQTIFCKHSKKIIVDQQRSPCRQHVALQMRSKFRCILNVDGVCALPLVEQVCAPSPETACPTQHCAARPDRVNPRFLAENVRNVVYIINKRLARSKRVRYR
jgi:hypothetical protein